MMANPQPVDTNNDEFEATTQDLSANKAVKLDATGDVGADDCPTNGVSNVASNEDGKSGLWISQSDLIHVLKVKHSTSKSGHRSQAILDKLDLYELQKTQTVDDNFCRKNKDSDIQMKFSCTPCRTVLESVQALTSHMTGKKHINNQANPPSDLANYILENGKWKLKKGIKRHHENRGRDPPPSKRERVANNKRARNIPQLPQHTDAKYEETVTYWDNGLRKIRPYYFTFVAHAKGRWVDQPLVEIFAREFRSMASEDLHRCITDGLIKVNDQKVDPNYRVQNNDFISHTVHRHELPVTGEKISIIHKDADLVVVDKPASIPVHPCGRYRHNTVLFILAKEEKLFPLHTVHRLDRLTSGVLILCRTSAKAREMEVAIKQRELEKEYVCRVEGEFPADEVTCEAPIKVISYKIGVCVVSPLEGKPCRTVFQRIQYKDGVSIVRCKPLTGRMHQIRVHLQYLGFPIANDPLYNSQIFGPDKGRDGVIGKTHQQLISDLIAHHSVENWIQSKEYASSRLHPDEDEDDDESPLVDDCGIVSNKDISQKEDISNGDDHPIKAANENGELSKTTSNLSSQGNGCNEEHSKPNDDDEKTSVCVKNPKEGQEVDPYCLDCKVDYKDPPKDVLVMYLHALTYSGPGWSFSTQMPAWAKL